MLPHDVLIDEQKIQKRVGQLAEVIAADLPTKRPVLLGLLTGSFVFLADLVRRLSRYDIEPRIHFIKVSHYSGGTETDQPIHFLKRMIPDLAGEAVLLVDDILDSGHSLGVVVDYVTQKEAAWLRLCTLLDKPSRHQVPLKVDYVGFEVPDVWLIGYGLDLGGEGRALPYIGAVTQENGKG